MRYLTQETVRHAQVRRPTAHRMTSAVLPAIGAAGAQPAGQQTAPRSARNRTHRAARRLRSMRAASAHRKRGERSSEMLTF
eukprot:2102547-Prymnesium_polylepis.1